MGTVVLFIIFGVIGDLKIGTGVEAIIAMFAKKLWGNLRPVEKMETFATFFITMNMIEDGEEQ